MLSPQGDRPRVAGVVVLYHPTEEVVENILSYLGDLDFLCAVDNSEPPDPAIADRLSRLPRLEYLPNGTNLGIAAGLNMGAARARGAGCGFLLTMDQDSRALPGMVDRLVACRQGEEGAGAGIVTPFHLTKPDQVSPAAGCHGVEIAMTSGNLLDLAAYDAVGPFREDLFMDFVDVEFCLRLRRAGYRIVQADGALLRHAVGDRIRIPLPGGDRYLTSHTPLRKYYKTRNRFVVADLYRETFPQFVRGDRRRFFLELGRLLLFEPRKMAKLRMLWRGWRDYRRGRMGRVGDEA